MVSCLNVSLQITENCLCANTKKTEKSKWKQQVRQLDSLSKLRRDIDSMNLKIDGTLK